jgi:putative phage-type endonuclease
MHNMNTQGSEAWFARRRGKVTASRVADVIATTKSGPSASRQNYLAQLVAERLTGTVEPSYTNGAMQWGVDNEPLARAAYEIKTDCMVEQIDFVDHPTIEMSGASPDGLVGQDGLIEIKCPNTATHIDYLLAGVVPTKYKPQMSWQIACTGRKWCDFASYDPRMPDDLQLFVVRFNPDFGEIVELEDKVIAFLKDVQTTIKKLSRINNQEPTSEELINTP